MGRNLLRYGIISIAFITIPIVFILFASAHFIQKNTMRNGKVKKTAELVTIGYFKKERNLDIVIETIKPSEEYRTHEIYLHGHVINNKHQKVSVIVNFSDNYSIRDITENSLKIRSI